MFLKKHNTPSQEFHQEKRGSLERAHIWRFARWWGNKPFCLRQMTTQGRGVRGAEVISSRSLVSTAETQLDASNLRYAPPPRKKKRKKPNHKVLGHLIIDNSDL